jgi:ribokinase
VAGGANTAVTARHVAAANLAGASMFLAQLETPVAAIEALFSTAAARAATRILNAAPAVDEGRRLLPLTDILVVNETELAHFAGSARIPEHLDDVAAAARPLLTRAGGQVVIVTLGKAGAVAVRQDSRHAIDGRPAQVVDTTGAGDCFCGVLAAQLAQGADLETALRWANAAASLSTERLGATPSMPTRAAIEAAAG